MLIGHITTNALMLCALHVPVDGTCHISFTRQCSDHSGVGDKVTKCSTQFQILLLCLMSCCNTSLMLARFIALSLSLPGIELFSQTSYADIIRVNSEALL